MDDVAGTRLARTTGGRLLVGDREGYVPLASAAPGVDESGALAGAAAGDLPGPDAAPADRVPAAALSLGPPLDVAGSKLWGIGLNYREHAADLDEDRPEDPASFLKPSSSVVGPGGPVRLPPAAVTDRVTAEAELAVVVGRTCRDADPETAMDCVAGYLPVLDLTAEDVLERNPRFLTRAKSFDTFLVLGPHVLARDAVPDPADVTVRTTVDGNAVAENAVGRMRFPPADLLAYHSRSTTLEPGDVFLTGTPGAGEIEPGSEAVAEVSGVGTVRAVVARNR